MCSIIGCLHNQKPSNVATTLVESMEKMEYRGYDSVGIATIEDAEIAVKKGVGKVKEVNQTLSLNYCNFGSCTNMWVCI